MPATVTVYFDYKSPFAYLAKAGAYGLERDFDVAVDWLPYTLDVVRSVGSVESRSEHQWRRIKYSYMDARRLAAKQGLTILGPKRIFDSRLANTAALYAKAQGPAVFRAYHDRVYGLFWKRELEIEDRTALEGVLQAAGADPGGFAAFAAGEGGAEHDRIRARAEATGVFGVPTFIVEGELYWGGDRLWLVHEKLDGMGLRRR